MSLKKSSNVTKQQEEDFNYDDELYKTNLLQLYF